jgi:hypothetical protein
VKFHPGQLLATPGALQAIEESGQKPSDFLRRHLAGDWGEVCAEDWGLNDQAVRDGGRVLSAYRTLRGVKLWVSPRPPTRRATGRPRRSCSPTSIERRRTASGHPGNGRGRCVAF